MLMFQTRECSLQLTGLYTGVNYTVEVRGIWKSGQVGASISRNFQTVSSNLLCNLGLDF